MGEILTYAVIGGDERQVWLSRLLAQDGNFVVTAGMERFPFGWMIPKVDFKCAAEQADRIILPDPAFTKDGRLYAPYAASEVKWDKNVEDILKGKRIWCGRWEEGGKVRLAPGSWCCGDIIFEDYSLDKGVRIAYGLQAAEGALAYAGRETHSVLSECRCMVLGLEETGVFLIQRLAALGAAVTAVSEKRDARLWAEALGIRAIEKKMLAEAGSFDLVFSTMPGAGLDGMSLELCAPEGMVFLLSGHLGQEDMKTARKWGIPVMELENQLECYAPKTVARAVKKAVSGPESVSC